jgi:hypothetical protein
MKRLLTSAAMFLCSLLTFAQFSGSGSGTENDPYLIFNPIQLNQMRNFLNKDGVYFKLMADIDLTEFLQDENPSQGWQPVGLDTAPFKGILDGNEKTISNLWIKRPSSDRVGLFGRAVGVTIKNLRLVNSSIIGSNYVGGFCGSVNGFTISNCYLSGIIRGDSYVGGFLGSGTGRMENNQSAADVIGNGDYVGGFVGELWNDKTDHISNCRLNNNEIRGNNNVGGILGYIMEGNISTCFAYTNIYGIDCVGGIVGFGIQNVYISDSGFGGFIIGHNNVGGIMGKGDSNNRDVSVTNTFSICDIISSGSYVGGITGRCESYFPQIISNCYYNGILQGSSYVGGIVGVGGGTIRCYSKGNIVGNKHVGGLAGSRGSSQCSVAINNRVTATDDYAARIEVSKTSPKNGSINENKSYNRTIVISRGIAQDIIDDEQNGTGVSSTTLKLKATYVAMGWDFNDTWEIQETECYPYFKTQTAPPVITSQVISGATTISGKCIDGGTVTLEIDGVKQQMVSIGNTFSFTVSPLQAGHEVRVSAKAEGKEQSYYTTETIAYLGKGTESDPYQVYTASDLTGVYRKGYFKLMNDIDLTSYINQFSPTEGWQSIGREGSETIHFDGNGHKITGLWCNSTRDNTGLFSCFANGSIKNLTVVTANGKQVKGGANTGILIGKLINGTITNCKVTGTVADGTPVGGMIGMLEGGKLIGCQADVTINVTGEDSNVGGLAGEVTGDVEQCLSYGTLTATGKDSYVGGLVGLSKSGSSISNSYSSAVVNSSLSAAGIVAYNYGVVDKCYAVGNLFSKNYGAGVVGYNDGEGAVVKNCAAMNNKIDVTYESQSAQGGNYGMRIIGGIKNGAPAPEMNNYALKTMQVSVNDVPQKLYDDILNGTAKTAAQLKSEATYKELGWDFNSVWKIEEGSSYPYQTEIIAESGSEEPINPEHPDDTGTVSVTDISKLSNAIYAQVTSSQPGFETNLTICLKNAQAATAYSFDLQLPAGVTLATNSNGDYQYTLSKRHNGHSETVNYQSGSGVYSFAVLSLQSKELNGNDGTIWTLRLKVANNVAKGDYAIKILNAKYSIASGSAKVNLPETTNKLTISDYKKGDANNDGDVDIADAVCIVNHVVGLPTPSFVKLAADANGDGDVDIADAVRIVNLVVGKINALSRGNGSLSNAATRAGDVTDAIIVDDMSVWAGDNCTVTVSLKNSQATNAYSFDLVLPEGVSIAQDSDGEYMYELSERHNGHMSTLNYIGNNTYSFAILSLQSKEVKGNDGAICTFKLKVAETAGGKQPVIIKNAKYSLTSGALKVTLPEATGQLTIKKLGDANGDGDVTEADVNAIAQHIMGQALDYFDKEAADVNGDQKVNAADIVEIVKIIKSK